MGTKSKHTKTQDNRVLRKKEKNTREKAETPAYKANQKNNVTRAEENTGT